MKKIFKYLIPAVLTWALVTYELLPDSFIKPIAVLVMFGAAILILLETGWQYHLRQGKTPKCRALWEVIEKDTHLWDLKTNILVVLFLLTGAVLFSSYTFLMTVFGIGTLYAVVEYLGYTGSKYNDDFSDPSGFV